MGEIYEAFSMGSNKLKFETRYFSLYVDELPVIIHFKDQKLENCHKESAAL